MGLEKMFKYPQEKGGKQRNKRENEQKTKLKWQTSPQRSIITSNVNVVNAPITKQRLAEWI